MNDSGGNATGATAPRLSDTDDRPPFEAPWQAEILGIAHTLIAQGLFTPQEWAEALGAERARDAARTTPGAAESPSQYFEAALRALETLTRAAGALDAAAIDRRQERWRRAYEATPHGDPVRLEAGGTE